MGTHPGDLISLVLSSANSCSTMLLKDIIDQRISPPIMDEMKKVILVIKLAFACLQQNPQLRPTMQDVSVQLAKVKLNKGEKIFSSIKIGELL